MGRYLLSLVLLLSSSLSAAWSEAPGPWTDSRIKAMGLVPISRKPQAPDFVLSDMNGKKVSLSSLKGKIVLLNFWATWCPPCREEMPTLETLFQTFKDRSDFVLLAVDSEEHKETVSEFLKNNPYRFPVLLDTTGEADLQYSIEAIPTTYLIDAQGEVVAGTKGAFDWTKKEFIDGLKLLLAAKN